MRRQAVSLLVGVLLIGLVSGCSTSPATSPKTHNPPIKVMPLGDSITYGYPGTGGYRVRLAHLASQENLSIDLVGTLQHGPPELTDKDHEGHGGWRIDQVTPNVASWMTVHQPDIVLLHIGTNDVAQEYQIAQAPLRLQTLVDSICRSMPGVRLVVASIGARDNSWDILKEFNAAMPAVVSTARDNGCNAQFLDMNKAMLQVDLPDGAHPNEVGYAKMADTWFPALRKNYDELQHLRDST